MSESDPLLPPAPLPAESRSPMDQRAIIGIGVVIVVVAALRFYRLDFDLPEVEYVDGFKFAGQAKRMAETGDLRPTHFQYPGLYVYSLVALYRAFGITSSYGQQLVATAVSAAFGTAVVGATAWAARSVTGGLGVLVASALAATSSALLTESRVPAPDAMCAFFMSVALVLAAKHPVRLRSWAMIGTAAGLATSAKWTGLFVLPVMGAAAIMSSWRQRSPRRVIWMTLVGAVGALAAFFVTNPYFLEMRDPYVKEFQLTMAIQRAGQIGRVQNGPLDYLLSRTPTWETPWVGTSLLSDLGLPGFLLATGGIALAATGRLGFAGGFYAATVLGYLLIVSGSGSVKAIRYLLPVFPFLWAFSGGAAERLLPPRARARRNPALWLAVVVAVVAVPAYHSLEYAVALRQPSTNALVREWMRQNVPKGSVVFLGPFFTNDFRQLPFRFRRLGGAGARQFGFPPEVGPNPERDPLYGPELVDKFRRAGVEYVVLNSYFDGALSRIPENERFFPRSVESYEAFLARLSAEADLVHVRKGWSEHRIGPDIWIWRLRAATGS